VGNPWLSPVLLARMRLRAARHDNARALGDWREAVRRIRRLRGFNAAWIEDLIAISDVHRALGDAEAVRQDLEQALRLARRWDTPTMVGQALHAQARAGVTANPIEVLREAVDLLANSPARLEYARALVSLGGSLRRQGQRVDSREPLRAGYDLARECRIVDMALGGAANSEIAQELFLTVKTVEMHLTNTQARHPPSQGAGDGPWSACMTGGPSGGQQNGPLRRCCCREKDFSLFPLHPSGFAIIATAACRCER
jgi:ATP/maltotriose-dependent transcriptional regulator MalT